MGNGEFRSMIVRGVFNFPEVERSESGSWSKKDGQDEDKFLDNVEDCFLIQMVHE